MPSPLKGKWTIGLLLNVTYQYQFNRFEYAARDIPLSRIQVQKILVYDGNNPGTGSRTIYRIRSRSWPQYYPYYTKFDSRGRARTYQRTTFHEYDVIIALDYLTISTPIRLRTGSDKKWEFNPPKQLIKSKENKYAPYLSVGDYNAKKNECNGDFFFAHSYNRKMDDCLYGRNYAGWQPEKYKTCFLTKHEISCVERLLNNGVLKK